MTQYGNVTYTYGADGVRKSKGNTEYIYDGDKLLAERWGSQEIEYIYGMDGIIGFLYSGIIYYYKKNLQGDVIEVKKYNPIAETVSTVARYVYDAYGNHKILLDTNGIGTLNPIRYRGYYYDVETGLYYLINRYYDPEIGRFISPDKISAINPGVVNGVNLYCYCYNSPVKYVDYVGNMPVSIDVISNLISYSTDFAHYVVDQVLNVTSPLTMQEAKKIARKEGHVKSAREIIRERNSDISDLTKSRERLKKFSKNFGRAMLAVDIAWSLAENIASGSDDWISDTIIDAGISIAIYAIGAFPLFGWAAAIAATVVTYYFDEEIEEFKDWFAESWDDFWSFA